MARMVQGRVVRSGQVREESVGSSLAEIEGLPSIMRFVVVVILHEFVVRPIIRWGALTFLKHWWKKGH